MTAPVSEQEYVVGFLLDGDGRVALIRKNRPTWQQGRLNGIGGRVEPVEGPDEAMRREFTEEAGADIGGWQPFVRMTLPDAALTFYRCWADPHVLDALRTMTDEPVALVPVDKITDYLIVPNLAWLVPLAAYAADRYALMLVDAKVSESVEETGACAMRQGHPFDFAWCDTHDTTFPFDAVCPVHRQHLRRIVNTCTLVGDLPGRLAAKAALLLDDRARGACRQIQR